MRYVILRDDDTNALTPPETLERLYRPFLERQLPVNLAVIPRVRTDAVRADGKREGFLLNHNPGIERAVPIAENGPLVEYLRGNPGYRVVQHGYQHTFNEFDSRNTDDIRLRLEQGARALAIAGFPKPKTFVAPYDKFSRASLAEIASRFSVFSTGWFELSRLPRPWWPLYVLKKLLRRQHWRMGRTLLLSHPGCLLSCHKPCEHMLEGVKTAVGSRQLTVLVTHWWEYFREGTPNEPFIRVLHDTANWLGGQDDVKVIAFDDLADNNVALA